MASELPRLKRVITYSRNTNASHRSKRRRFDENEAPKLSFEKQTSSDDLDTQQTASIDLGSSTTLTNSPSSSPPPKSIQKAIQKNTFSFFTRRQPLSVLQTSSNKCKNDKTAPNPVPPKDAKPRLLTQMQIDLDGLGAPRITCKECGMPYTPSSTEDSKIHKKFHDKHVDGIGYTLMVPVEMRTWDARTSDSSSQSSVKAENVDPAMEEIGTEPAKKIQSKFFQAMTKNVIRQKKERLREGYIVTVHHRSSAAEKRKALEILAFVNNELSASDLPESMIWSLGSGGDAKVEPNDTDPKTALAEVASAPAPPAVTKTTLDIFKILLYIVGKKCIGLCLAERISKAWEVQEQIKRQTIEQCDSAKSGRNIKSSSITITDISHPAVLGVSRIWTCASYRRLGVASQLVQCATEAFIYGMKIDPSQVAFSQPTETGGHFARAWARVKQESPVGDVNIRKNRLLVYME